MKKLTLVIAIIIPMCVCAQQKLTRKQKKINKLIEKLDVLEYLPDTTDHNPSTFWNCVTRNNKPFQEELAKFNNPSGLAKKAYDEVNRKKSECYIMNMSYDPNTEGETNNMLHHDLIGEKCLDGKIIFRLRADNEVNAFCTPDGYVYINTGLMKKSDNYEMTLGVLAHEVAHYMFRHMLIHEYMTLKRKRANSIVATISLIGATAANAVGASSGGRADSAAMADSYKGIVEGANEWTKAYHYRYGRENELMSDIVAYRFLEYIGADPDQYIRMLKTLSGYWTRTSTERYDDHPSPEDRIEVLRSLKPAYGIANRETVITSNESSVDDDFMVFVCPDSNNKTYHIDSACYELQNCSGNVKKKSLTRAIRENREPCSSCCD